MEDFSMTLVENESVELYTYQGHKDSERIQVFVWVQSENSLIVAITINKKEEFAIEVTNNGKTLRSLNPIKCELEIRS